MESSIAVFLERRAACEHSSIWTAGIVMQDLSHSSLAPALQKVKKQRERWKTKARKGKDEKEDNGRDGTKTWYMCVSSLRKGHATLPCVVPICSPRGVHDRKCFLHFPVAFFHCCFANFSHYASHCPFVLFAFFLHSFAFNRKKIPCKVWAGQAMNLGW